MAREGQQDVQIREEKKKKKGRNEIETSEAEQGVNPDATGDAVCPLREPPGEGTATGAVASHLFPPSRRQPPRSQHRDHPPDAFSRTKRQRDFVRKKKNARTILLALAKTGVA